MPATEMLYIIYHSYRALICLHPVAPFTNMV